MYYVLTYDLVDNILEKRKPYRQEHLELAEKMKDQNVLVQAGAFDPPSQSMFIFKTEDKQLVEDFAQKDPYVTNGLVPNYTIRKWTVVIGA